MTQTTAAGSGGSNVSNLMTTSSTPIRIGSGLSSYHGNSSASVATHHAMTGNDSSSPGGGGSAGTGTSAVPQSSSVPSGAADTLRQQLQSQISLSMGASNQSLGVSAGAVGVSSITPPNSAGLRQTGAFDFKFMRRASSKVLLPKLPSTDSLSNSPGPSSPGLASWATDSRDKYDGNQTDKTPGDPSKLNRKESYKAQRKNYRREKKRVASELLNSLQDPTVVVLADWLKVRGTLKSWTKLWCVLKPGMMLLYKSPKLKSSHWVGTIMLTSCQVIERPSKKDGFCFKLFHPLEQSIWAPRGPDKETIGAVVQPLPTAYLIFRAPSQAAGKCWMDALELSLRCSALLLRSNSSLGAVQGTSASDNAQISHETQWSEADYEKHFNEHDPPPERFSPCGSMQKQYSQYLMVPELSKSHASSDTSLASRAQTPILQQLYMTMTHWERVVANSAEKNLRKLRKAKHLGKRDSFEGMSSMGDLSDVSSVDFPSMLETHQSLKLKARRQNQFMKSASLGPMAHETSSSIDSVDENVELQARSGASRALSAPPFVLNVKDLDGDSQNEGGPAAMSGVDTESESDQEAVVEDEEPETPYVPLTEEEFGSVGEQVEELADENKSLIWILVKQVRPGMDLSKVVLPTFILEPRSFLDKLSDSYYHADILSRAVTEDDPFTRMKTVVQWYLSGFYKKPKGLKKPYNPILGETFRCYWEHPNGSRTFYIAEQVSHHPPVSAFYVTNRQDGFCISCSILAKSKFYGNSTSAVLEGVATLTLLPRGETYTLNTPYAHCKGILVGTLSMELGGKVNIECENTGYKTELEFKLKPFLGGSDYTNLISGKIKLGKETMATISGHWDTEMTIKEAKTGEETVLFKADADTKHKRLVRYVVPLDAQLPNESERLWEKVSLAIRSDDQVGATEEKTVLEEAQRNSAKERKVLSIEWMPVHFNFDPIITQWMYNYADLRPWDQRNDLKQYEANYKVLTKTRHRAPMVRNPSIVTADPMQLIKSSSLLKVKHKSLSILGLPHDEKTDSSGSNPDVNKEPQQKSNKSIRKLVSAIEKMNHTLEEQTKQLRVIQTNLERIHYNPRLMAPSTSTGRYADIVPRTVPQTVVIKSMVYAFVGLAACFVMKWMFK
ncbi:oxysterol-binding protein-related protein 8 isoform X1 [Bactrocera neohumeralis]|uniref:oxysterol-binding protein-related protein 8 isoform X1 n=1 Tax=Bactrocera neohumeralis TaxID=98809 RepID=UPI0021666D70|nr:oxysterol-binding protein-related protein 8 isoform X1 [Bactrocera neohumeralis]